MDIPFADIEKALLLAEEKGCHTPAVITKQGVFVINTATRTIITAVSSLRMNPGIFTNIDSFVISEGVL